MKKIYVFGCNGNDKIFGFSVEETGKSLPLKFCGNDWKFLKQTEVSEGSPSVMGAAAIDILNGIELNGYHVSGVEENFAEGSQRRMN